MLRQNTNLVPILLQVAFCAVLFATGVALGVAVQRFQADVAENPAGDDPTKDQEEEDHVHLSEQAFKNLGLKIAPVKRADYTRRVSIPCEVVEQRGISTVTIAAPVTGVVTRIRVVEGQAISRGDPLFDLAVIDEELTMAQIELLNVMAQLDVLQREIERLAPATASGALAGSRKLKLENEKRQLDVKRQLHLQELLVRGLSQNQIDELVGQKKLVREVIVSLALDTAPRQLSEQGVGQRRRHRPTGKLKLTSLAATPRSRATSSDLEYSIERLSIQPGVSVQRGENMCQVAYHTRLLVKGQAFESDIENITTLRRRGWKVGLELGHPGDEIRRNNLDVLYVDNHVDAQTQTFPFYVPLTNEPVDALTDPDGRVFRSWRFKPGQRGHFIVPVETHARRFVLPLAAVVREGPEAFVFRVHKEPDDPPAKASVANDPPEGAGGPPEGARGDADQHEAGVFIEFEPVPVHILLQDGNHVVVADEGELREGDMVAMNQAYKLNLALKVHAGGGGHDHHSH